MNLFISKEVKILTLAFLFIFLGFNGVQQYLTSFFSEAGIVRVGFNSLILIYLFFLLFDPIAAMFVSKYGAKKCMLLAILFYSLFIFSLLVKLPVLIYITSSLLGIAASFLWVGQGSYLIRVSNSKYYGENAGFFNSLQFLGSGLGVLFLGFLIVKFSFRLPFLFYSVFPIIGFLVLLKLKEAEVQPIKNRLRLIKKAFTNSTALRLSSIWFSFMFIFGLVIGMIPLAIKNTLGVNFIGIFSSLFFILPIAFSYFFGRLSDIKGRKIMILLSYLICILGLIFLYLPAGTIFLILGIILLALNRSIIAPVTTALVGDVADKGNLEFLTALFWMARGTGVVSALIISNIFQTKIVYLISIGVIIASFFVVLPMLKLKLEEIKEKISLEVS